MSDSSNDKPQFTNPLVKWVDYRLPIFTYMDHELNKYPTPRNLTYWWNYGSLAGVMLSVMIFSGIFLAMNYQPNADLAFGSIQHIMRDVNYGWLMRYIHMNGASMFFLLVYIHMFRGLYYGSYKSPRELLWLIGVVILLMMMAASFEGYVLPWGQMSYWGATVITNLFSAIPLVGQEIVTWLWGGFSVSQPTLNRFFALHYLIPFLILGVVVLHVVALHQHGSNNPLGIDMKGPQDRIPFHPYYTIKDAYGLALFFIFYAFFVFYAPSFFGEPDNSIPANPLATPSEIVPEWYFLPYYAILRAFPTKLSGVIFFAASVMIFFVLPWLDGSPVRSGRYRPWFKKFFWIFVIDCIGLGWIGGNSPTGSADILGIVGIPYLWIGRVLTFWYFFHFVVVLPLLGRFEPRVPLPVSISEEVLKERHGKGGGPLTPSTVPMEKP